MNNKIILLLVLITVPSVSIAGDREIKVSVDVPADIQSVWDAWTSAQGIKSFFAPGVNIEPRAGGLYEILFFPENEKGLRGAEGVRLIALEAPGRLVFTWNNPPSIPRIRMQYAVVEVKLMTLEENRTRVQLIHGLFGDGKDWENAYDYFSGAWPIILKRLVYSFENGPVDWQNLARGLSYQPG